MDQPGPPPAGDTWGAAHQVRFDDVGVANRTPPAPTGAGAALTAARAAPLIRKIIF